MAVVGLALASLAAPLAATLGAAGLLSGEFAAEIVAKTSVSSILWTGAYFGSFGALSATVTPIINKLFREKTPDQGAGSWQQEASQDVGQAPDLALAQGVGMAHGGVSDPSALMQATPTHFQDLITVSKAAAPGKPFVG